MKTPFLFTALAMTAFAGNSLLCRQALRATAIDPGEFTAVRIVSGAACLWLILRLTKRPLKNAGNWPSALALLGYALFFSLAYIELSAGTGALLLFGAVQATMIFWGILRGERMRLAQIGGLLLAVAGLVALVSSGVTAPGFAAALLMLAAGVCWGIYSLRGKGSGDPVATTTGNFMRAAPVAVAISIFIGRRCFGGCAEPANVGVVYAVLSGALASGVGYAIWYTALPRLKATAAATVQLSVPVLAAAGGILFLGEPITLRFALASVAVLGGILLVILERRTHAS